MQLVARIAAVALATAATPLAAATYTTALSGANETMPNASPATGTGILTLSSDQNTIRVQLNWAGLTAPARASHIHCCAFQGANGPVAIGFVTPAATTASLDQFYDLTSLSTYSGGFQTGQTAATKRSSFLAGLMAGKAYYNIHNTNFGAGEIRGQLTLAAVPEPASWALMIGGFGLVGGALRRQRVITA